MRKTRADYLRLGKEDPDYPDIPSHSYLIGWLFIVGPVDRGGMATTGVSHTEIGSWARNIDLEFEGFDAEWLHEMSKQYADQLERSDGKDVPAPFTRD